MKRLLQYNILIFIGILVPTVAKADSWMPPRVETYYSRNREYKLIVTPTLIPKKYYLYCYKSDKRPKSKRILRKKDKLEQQIIPCTAELYKRVETGRVLIWKKPLLNDICPVYAIVANDGSSVATFDNWHSMGYGENVFVIYDDEGEAKRSYKLEEISLFPLNDYLTTRSSIRWLSGARFFDNETIEIVFATKNSRTSARSFSSSFIFHLIKTVSRVANKKSL